MSDNKQVQEGEVYLGEFPLMTDRASFVVNGAERVVVSQLHRSPGISFDQEWHPSGKRLHAFRIIPDRGVWVEVQFDANDLLYVYLDRRRRRYRFLITTLLRAFGFGTNEAILKLFYKPTKMRVSALLSQTDLMHWVLTEDVIDEIFTGRTFDLFFLMAKVVQVNYLDFSMLSSLPIGFRKNAEETKQKIMASLGSISNQ